MSLTFPTRRGSSLSPMRQGTPNHARPCQCDRPLIIADTDACLRCGRYPKRVISETWQQRAEQVAARSRRRKTAQ